MRHLLLASHGPLAGAILESALFICGSALISPVKTIMVAREDSGERIRTQVEQILSGFEAGDEIIALTDVFGGNVNNILTEYLSAKKLYLVAGMNLGMVLEALLAPKDMQTEELAAYLENVGKEGVRYVNRIAQPGEEDEL